MSKTRKMRGKGARLSKRFRLLISALAAVLVALCFVAYGNSIKKASEKKVLESLDGFQGETCTVIIAKRHLEKGELIQKEDLEAAMWVAQLCPEHTVTQKDEIVGMSLTSQVPQGAVLSHRYFEAEKPQIEIPSGHVAFCLPITDRNNFPQNLVSGQNIAAYEMEDGAMRLVSSNIKVLDAENLGVRSTKTISLAARAKDVPKLLLASENKSLRLVVPATDLVSLADDMGSVAPKKVDKEKTEQEKAEPEKTEPEKTEQAEA